MGFRFIPREENFFDLLEAAAQNVCVGARTFKDLIANWSLASPKIEEIRRLEHEGDRITHELIDKLNRTFITPLDREDIHALAKELDDVIDIIQATVDRMAMFRIDQTTPQLSRMVDTLVKGTDVIDLAIKSMRNPKQNQRKTLEYCIEANRLENEGDTLLKVALEELFAEGGHDVLSIIKWKEIYEAAEFATDKCEDIANVIEGIVVKNA